MSWNLPAGAVMAPHHRGLASIEGELVNDPNQYSYYAYRHPHGLSWFGGARRRPGELTRDGGMTHYIVSGFRSRRIPSKPDEAVAAINVEEFRAMVRDEHQWWEDRNNKLVELTRDWVQQHHPGRPLRDLAVPAHFKRDAAKYAHRQVAVRAGEEDMLPDDHDDVDFEDLANRGLDWDLL